MAKRLRRLTNDADIRAGRKTAITRFLQIFNSSSRLTGPARSCGDGEVNSNRTQVRFEVVGAEADGVFRVGPMTLFSPETLKIERSLPIMVETEQIPNRRNSLLKSKAQISDGLESRFLIVRRKILRCWISALQ